MVFRDISEEARPGKTCSHKRSRGKPKSGPMKYNLVAMKIPRLFAAVVLFFALSASAQNPSFTLEQVMSSPFPSDLTTASQSGRIAWVFALKGDRNVWIADGPAFQARQITHYQGDDGQQILSLRLTPDGRTAVYARGSEIGRESHVANPVSQLKEPKQQVWAADVET